MSQSVLGLTPRLFALSAATMLFIAVLLAWSGWRVIEFERLLAEDRRQQNLSGAADRIAASLLRRLSTLESELSSVAALPETMRASRLAQVSAQLSSDAVILSLGPEGADSFPDLRLAYYPVVPSPETIPEDIARADALEFRDKDYRGAISQLSSLSSSPDAELRAAALIRLARNYAKLNSRKRALDALDELTLLDSVRVDTVPAGLLGRYSRCTLFDEFADEVPALHDDLVRGRWKLDRATYRFYEQALQKLSERDVSRVGDALHLAAVADDVWADWQVARQRGETLPGISSRLSGEVSVLTLAAGREDLLLVLLAGPRQLGSAVLDTIRPLLDEFQLSVRLTADGGLPVIPGPTEEWAMSVTRHPVDTGLPWSLSLGTVDPTVFGDEFAFRRSAIIPGLVFVFLLILASVYSIARASTRELEVARLKSDFVAAVSHEFRTPLTSLRQFTEMLADDRLSDEEDRRSYYQILRNETSRLHRLVENLLDFGSLEAGPLKYRKEQVDVNALVASLTNEFQDEVSHAGYRVETRLSDANLLIAANREALSRAIWNLLENAVKYSPDSKRIKIVAELAGKMVAIRVVDQGLGIAQSEQAKIFEKFVRGSASEQVAAKGTGLGLTMIREIVEEHGGRIEVHSEEGRGSTFSILLPLAG